MDPQLSVDTREIQCFTLRHGSVTCRLGKFKSLPGSRAPGILLFFSFLHTGAQHARPPPHYHVVVQVRRGDVRVRHGRATRIS